MDLYEENFSFLFHYSNFDTNRVKTYDTKFNVRVVVNPKVKEQNVIAEYKKFDQQQKWVFQGGFAIQDTLLIRESTDLCLVNNLNAIIFTPDSKVYCEQVQKILCDNKIGKDCNEETADFEKGKDLIFKLQGTSVTFSPQEYTYFDEEKQLNCHFGDTYHLRHFHACVENTEFGVGKLFLTKAYPVLQFSKDGNSLIFLKNYDFPPNKRLMWTLVIICIAIVLVAAFIYFLVVKKRQSDEAFYTEI